MHYELGYKKSIKLEESVEFCCGRFLHRYWLHAYWCIPFISTLKSPHTWCSPVALASLLQQGLFPHVQFGLYKPEIAGRRLLHLQLFSCHRHNIACYLQSIERFSPFNWFAIAAGFLLRETRSPNHWLLLLRMPELPSVADFFGQLLGNLYASASKLATLKKRLPLTQPKSIAVVSISQSPGCFIYILEELLGFARSLAVIVSKTVASSLPRLENERYSAD